MADTVFADSSWYANAMTRPTGSTYCNRRKPAVAAARKRAGINVGEPSEAGLAPWSLQTGAIHGGRGRSRLDRVGHLGTMAA